MIMDSKEISASRQLCLGEAYLKMKLVQAFHLSTIAVDVERHIDYDLSYK